MLCNETMDLSGVDAMAKSRGRPAKHEDGDDGTRTTRMDSRLVDKIKTVITLGRAMNVKGLDSFESQNDYMVKRFGPLVDEDLRKCTESIGKN